MGKKKKIKILIAGCIAVLGLMAIAVYPVQRHIALKTFQEYTAKQGIAPEIIDTREVFNDWKNGGILIRVTFKDDPDNTYFYHYHLWTHKKDTELKWNDISLSVVDDQAIELDAPYDGKCKHPPISE